MTCWWAPWSPSWWSWQMQTEKKQGQQREEESRRESRERDRRMDWFFINPFGCCRSHIYSWPGRSQLTYNDSPSNYFISNSNLTLSLILNYVISSQTDSNYQTNSGLLSLTAHNITPSLGKQLILELTLRESNLNSAINQHHLACHLRRCQCKRGIDNGACAQGDRPPTRTKSK